MIDVARLIEWLGVDGAIAGLGVSELSISELLEACSAPPPPNSKMKRADVIKWIVESVRAAQTKDARELMEMDAESLREYFHSIRASREEILSLLSELDIRPKNVMRQNLIEFASREISDIGMFKRVADGGKSSPR